MKKLLTILILLLTAVSQGLAGTEIISNFSTVNETETTFSVNDGKGTFRQLAGAWAGGIQWEPESGIWAYRLVVETESNADLKIEVEYDGGMSTAFYDAQATNQRILNLEHSKKITKIFIQDKTGGSQETPNVIVFTSINYDDEKDATAETGKTKLLDCFTPYPGVTYSNHKFSGPHDGGMQCWINENSNIHNSSIIVETSESKMLEIGIEYTDGWYAKYKAESKNFNLSIDPKRNIKKLEIYNRSGASISELEFTEMLISNAEGNNPTIPKYSIKSGFTGTDENRTQTYTVPNETDLYAKDLYLKFNSSITAQILVTYTDSDNPVEYANKEAQERHLKLNFAKKLKEIKVISTSPIEWSWEDMYVGEEESNEFEMPTTLTLSWTGTKALSSETPVSVAASEFSSITAGTRVQFNTSANGTIKVTTTISSEEVTLQDGNVYGSCFFEVTEGNISSLKENGISITGTATLSEINITSTYSTGTITLDDAPPLLPCGWDSGYNTSNKTVTINSAWGARGWFVGDDKYNDKKCITVNFAESGVSAAGVLKMEYIKDSGMLDNITTNIETSSTSASLDIPTSDLVRIVQVYITSETVNATYVLSSVEVEEKTTDNRTEKTLVTANVVCGSDDEGATEAIPGYKFKNAVAGDKLVVHVSEVGEAAYISAKHPVGNYPSILGETYSTAVGGGENECQISLTADIIASLKAKGLIICGKNLTIGVVALYTESALGTESDNRTFTYNITPEGSGTVEVRIGGTDGEITSATSFLQSTQLTVTAKPNNGYQFVKWKLSNNEDDTTNPTFVCTLEDNIQKTAVFESTPVFDEDGKADLSKFVASGNDEYNTTTHIQIVSKAWEGGIGLTIPASENISAKYLIVKFEEATAVKVMTGYSDNSTAPNVIMDSNATEMKVALDVTKVLTQVVIQGITDGQTVKLSEVSISNKCTLTVAPATYGSVAVTQGQTPTTATEFDYGTSLTLTATANEGYEFSKWLKNGEAAGTEATLTVTMDADVTIEAVFKGSKLNNEERRTLWENSTGQALDWSLMFAQSEEVGEIVEAGEILIFSVSAIGDNPKIWLMSNDGNTTIAEHNALTVGENRMSITSDMVTKMAGGFKFKGGDATITKIELYKPTPITALEEEETKTLWSNTSGTALTWNTIAIDRAAEWGAVLEEDERIVISVKAKETGDNVWPTVQLQNDTEKIASTANLLNDLTVPCDITITLTAEMVNKMKNGFSITGDKATITKAVLYKPTMPAKTVHTLNSTETAISGDANVTVAAAKFANISAYDVLTVNFTITASPANVILKGNGEDGGWDYLKEMKFENGETLFALPLTPAMTSNLKKNGLQITGSDYKCKSVTIKTAGEVPSDGEDDISNDASEEAKKVYNVLKDLYGKKIVSGVVANVDWNTKEAENVYGWTGKYPAMNVYDYINLHASKDVNSAGWVDYSDITTAKNWWKEGGIVGAMWHWQVKANNGTDYTCTPGTAAGETSFDASKVYVEGTSENTLAKQQLDQLCGYLKKMQDAGIPVVWRPLHEASGNVEQYSGGKAWFWWGAKGADVYKQLWQWMYNYMVKTKGLNNLIWVWTSQTKDNNWYPGDAYVDIIGRDNYGATAATLATEYEAQKAAYPNKMITLSECGNSESTEMAKLSSIWDAGSRWSWFMTWYDGDYNKGASTTHKHAGETWWKDAVSKDYVITRDKMKELLGQESSDDSKTGVNISLEDLNEGWSSSYNATTKTITTEGEWAARGWYIGDNRYNSKGSVTVKFEAVDFGVTLKMEYTNTGGESKSVSAGAAAGETGVELDIPADIKTMDKVYITYQPIGTLKLTEATVNDKVVDNRTERTLVEKSQAISDGDIAINRGLFSNAVAGDEIRIYADGLSESSKLALEPGDYSGAFDGANWTGFTESPFKLKLTATLIATIKEKGLLIRGESFTFKKAVLYTEKELGSEISDEEKKGDEEKDDDETIIDEKTGEADLTVLSAQDDTKTTLTENEDGSITMTTTEPYCAAQIWFSDPEPVAGNVLKVELAESKVNVTITVQYTDGTQSQMSANTSGVATARAATRGDSDPGTTIEVPLETGKEVQNIEVKNNVAGTITIKKMQVTTINIFTNGVANLSMLKPQSNATYDTAAHTLATTKGWTGATISPVANENVSGKELLIEFADASKVKVAVKYRTDVEGPSTIMEKAAKTVRLALDNTKNIQEISIQPTEASIVTFKKIAVNSEESDDGTLKPGKTITLWESAAGETLSWNEVAKQDASVGEMLQEYDELLITISGVTDGCDWPKVFIRDASSEQAGNEVLLNDVGSFPYTVRIVLTGEMAQQLQKGFSICGDGVTVTKLQVYRPEAPKTGDIHLADLNYGYNSSYDKGTHTITTTARWAARGWEIGDKRYNDKNLITVKFEPVDFPVTLKMEYTTGLQTAQATSVGVPAGRTELLLEIPSGISKLDRVYIIYENPGSVKLTEASVTYQDKLKLSTAIEAFEAEGVIHDGRYDTDGWYNLRGMRIAEPKTSGIYIHGGKKVVIY